MSEKIPTSLFLGDYLFSESLTHLLVVGDLPQGLLSRPPEGVSIQHLPNLDEAEQWVLTSATNTEEATQSLPDEAARALVLALDPDDAHYEQILGRAVRAFPHRILLHCTATSDAPGQADEAFFAFGFRKLQVAQDDKRPEAAVRWFEYRLSQYKPSPDWLNARFWANPERFDVDAELDEYWDDAEDDEEE